MTTRTYPYLVPPQQQQQQTHESVSSNHDETVDLMAARRLSDKASLLRPLQDEHLLEVYREAKKMNLSSEFIELLEEAITMRHLEHRREA
jgi:developmental checkpoint coupling sporulation initiation to replication initiation